MKKPKKQESKPEEKKPDRLTPDECALAGDFYERAALRVQELYGQGASVNEAVKSCLAEANLMRAGKHYLVDRK